MEIKVILYLIAGVAYFIYKQFQKLQKEAETRKAKLESASKTASTNDTRGFRSFEELLERKNSEHKKPVSFKDEPAPVINSTDLKSVVNINSGYFSTPNIANENYKIEEIENSELIYSGNNESTYSQVRSMILYSELLKRPCY